MRHAVLVLVLVPACLNPTTDLDTTTSSESSSSGDGSTSSSSESSSTGDTSSSDTSSSTGEPPPCDDDPACGPGEDVLTCPEQCNVCGDAVVVAPEPCDNGVNTDAPYSATPPGPDACAPGCVTVEYCGDASQNGPEPCDSGGMQTATCEADCRIPACGDGTLNLLANETCDDNNLADGDGCSANCIPERRVFASSTPFKGDLNYAIDNPDLLAGIPLADARCNALALSVGLPPTFKAWLSDSEMSPATRFDTAFTGLYRLLSPDFPILATGWPDLTDGTLAHAIDADETGALTQENILTNTAPDGSSASDQHCTAWTANDDTSTTIGKSSATDATWTNLGQSFCSDSRRLYCFEDP
jgi:cysteine-rich repeat protein